jgi:hypothetical protein
MYIKYLAFPTDRFPCFGFVVCTKDGKKLYLPEYGENDRLYRFEEVEIKTMYLHEYDKKCEIIENHEKIYAYMLNKDTFIVDEKEPFCYKLTKALDDIQNAPFSKLELAKFLNVDKRNLNKIKKECYTFLKGIDEEYARQWARDNSFFIHILRVKPVLVPYINKKYVLRLNLHDILMLEKQNKAFLVKSYGRNKKHIKKKSAIVAVVVYTNINRQREYVLKLESDDILKFIKQNKAFPLSRKNKKKSEYNRLGRCQTKKD